MTVQAIEETSTSNPFGTGRKIVREVTVLRGNEKLAGFGGLGQRPNPMTERAIETNSGSTTGGIAGSVFLEKRWEEVWRPRSGSIPDRLLAGTANRSQDGGYQTQNKSDYGTDASKPNLVKGLQ